MAASRAGLASFSGKSQSVNILGILGHVFFSTLIFSPRAAVDSIQIDKLGRESKDCIDGCWNAYTRHFVRMCLCLVHVWVHAHGVCMMCVYVQVEARGCYWVYSEIGSQNWSSH